MVEGVYRGLMENKSSIPHKEAGVVFFAARRIGVNEPVGSYYGTMVYSTVKTRVMRGVVYGYSLMAPNAERFEKVAMKAPGKVLMQNGSTAFFWIVPAPFCVMGPVKNPRYRDRDETPHETSKVSPREANVCFIQAYTAVSSDFKNFALLSIRATRKIEAVEELFVFYGDYYTFTNNLKAF